MPRGTQTTREVAFNLSLVALWLAAFAKPLAWWGRRLAAEPFQLVLAVGAAALLARTGWRHRAGIAARLTAAPALAPLPFALVVASALGFLAAERWLDLSILAASMFGVGTYGLFGLYATDAAWRRGAPVALLLMGLLPFGAHLDAYAGFVLRAVSADAASAILTALGIEHVSSETILVLENGVAHVDVPCSGIRGLWTGALFFLGATVLAKRPLGARFLVVGAFHCAALVAANIVRITIVTIVAVAADLPRVAQVIHEPLGILGFLLAGIASWFALRGGAPAKTRPTRAPSPFARYALAATAALTIAFHSERAKTGFVDDVAAAAPASLGLAQVALTAEETDLFSRFGASGATKYAGDFEGRALSLILVDSRAWRAHHPPELCLAASGHRIERIEDVAVDADHVFRVAQLEGQQTAVFWFQSSGRTTGHALDRILSGVLDRGRRWVLVSALVDDATDPADVYRVVSADLAAQLERNRHELVRR